MTGLRMCIIVGLLISARAGSTETQVTSVLSQTAAEAAPTAHPPPLLLASTNARKPSLKLPLYEYSLNLTAGSLEQRTFRLTQEDTYDELILNTAVTWQLEPFLFKGLLYAESRLDPKIINKTSGAAGIAQFTVGGRRSVTNLRRMRGIPPSRATFTRAQALDPNEAIPAAAEILVHLLSVCKTTSGALMAYNSGGCRGSRVFVRTVIKHTNRLRTTAGLPPLPAPSFQPRSNRTLMAKLPNS